MHDVKDVRVGDVVTVRAEVRAVTADQSGVALLVGTCMTGWVDARAIVSLEPRPIKVGDRVRSTIVVRGVASIEAGEVLAIHDATAWVKFACDPAPRNAPLYSLTLEPSDAD